MLQATKNKYCKETFLRLNQWYSRIHGLAAEDIEKVNAMVEHIEMTRSDRQPKVGDRLVFVSRYGERSRPFFIDAVYGESVSLRSFSCVPFVSRNEKGIQSDMPGGECMLAETGRMVFKTWATDRFKHWGRHGMSENGEIYYDAKTGLWELMKSGHADGSDEWFKIHIRKNEDPDGEMYTGEMNFKNEDELRRFMSDHEGSLHPGNDSRQFDILCFRHSDMRIPPEEWKRIDRPVALREIYGHMQEVKIVKDYKRHLTTFYY